MSWRDIWSPAGRARSAALGQRETTLCEHLAGNDGFHDLETVFYPIQFRDFIEVIHTSAPFSFTSSGNDIPGNKSDNLCIKAYELLKNDYPNIPPAQLHLHKVIPTGAGLGGGSADGAFTLQLLNKKFNLDLSSEQLMKYALQLGSDCPFFIINKPCLATGRGEKLEPVSIDLSTYQIILVNPGIAVHTSAAFSNITPALPKKSTADIIQQPIDTWKEELINDFEDSIFKQHPSIAAIKDKLYNAGAIYASMSGSGSTVYGIFDKEVNIKIENLEFRIMN